MAHKIRRLDLATAEQADGALPAFRSVHEISGMNDVRYRHNTFAAYRAHLRSLNLIDLQDHAYAFAVVPSQSAQTMISRLEEKYLRDNPQQRPWRPAARLAGARK